MNRHLPNQGPIYTFTPNWPMPTLQPRSFEASVTLKKRFWAIHEMLRHRTVTLGSAPRFRVSGTTWPHWRMEETFEPQVGFSSLEAYYLQAHSAELYDREAELAHFDAHMTIAEARAHLQNYLSVTDLTWHNAVYEINKDASKPDPKVRANREFANKERFARSNARVQARYNSTLGPASFYLAYEGTTWTPNALPATPKGIEESFLTLPQEVRAEINRMGAGRLSKIQEAIATAPRKGKRPLLVVLGGHSTFWYLQAGTPGVGKGEMVTIAEAEIQVHFTWAKQTTTTAYYPAEVERDDWNKSVPLEAREWLQSKGVQSDVFQDMIADAVALAIGSTDEGWIPHIAVEFPGHCDSESLDYLPVLFKWSGDHGGALETAPGDPLGLSPTALRFVAAVADRLESLTPDLEQRIDLARDLLVEARLALKSVALRELACSQICEVITRKQVGENLGVPGEERWPDAA